MGSNDDISLLPDEIDLKTLLDALRKDFDDWRNGQRPARVFEDLTRRYALQTDRDVLTTPLRTRLRLIHAKAVHVVHWCHAGMSTCLYRQPPGEYEEYLDEYLAFGDLQKMADALEESVMDLLEATDDLEEKYMGGELLWQKTYGCDSV